MKLLLDEHLSPKLVAAVRALAPALDVASIHHWQDAQFTNQPDERILRAAAAQDRVLVTFDLLSRSLLRMIVSSVNTDSNWEPVDTTTSLRLCHDREPHSRR